jgi:hypothetical protein
MQGVNRKLIYPLLAIALLAVFLLPALTSLPVSAIVVILDGRAWSVMTSGTTNNLNGVWGSSYSDVFAVGDHGTILCYNGSAWSVMNSGTGNHLNGVWGSSYSDVFAVGSDGTILHCNGSFWSPITSNLNTNNLNGVWGSSPSDVFAVGDHGTILYYNGSAWSVMNSGTAKDLFGVWGSSSSDVFAVGSDGSILHYDGSAWGVMNSSTGNGLNGVWGSSSSDVFAVGSDSSILCYNGSAWSVMNSSTGNDLNGVWGSSSSDVFAVGINGTILHYYTLYYSGSDWSPMTSGTSNELRGIWGSSYPNVFAVGSDGTILRCNEVTTTRVVSSANPSVYGQPVTFTATVSQIAFFKVGTPTGTVQFQIDGSNFGSAVPLVSVDLVNGIAGATSNATATLSIGSHTVTAVYSGDSNFAASTGNLSQVVKHFATTTKVASSANPLVHRQSVTFIAIVSAAAPGAGIPTGTVIFQEGNIFLGSSTLSNGTATSSISTLSVGNHSITAVYDGDTDFAGSTSSGLIQTVNAAPVNWGLIGVLTVGYVAAMAALVYFLVIRKRAR